MSLWIVTNSWLGNANEGVIVQADSEEHAFKAAREALVAHWTAQREKDAQRGWSADHADEHLVTYEGDQLRWWAEEITLPYVGEF